MIYFSLTDAMKKSFLFLTLNLTITTAFAQVQYDPNYILKSSDPNGPEAIYLKNFIKPASNYETFEYVFNSEVQSYRDALDSGIKEEICTSIESLNNLLLSNIGYVEKFNLSSTRELTDRDYQDILKGIIEEKELYRGACQFKK